MSYRIFAVAPSTAGAEPYHRMGYNTARSGAHEQILEVWAGATSATRKFWVDKDGAVFLNVSLTTNVGVGELVLGNAKNIRAVNAAGNDTIPLIVLTSGNNVQLASGSGLVIIGAPASLTSAVSGGMVLAHGKVLYGVNAAGNECWEMISLDTTDSVRIGNSHGNIRIMQTPVAGDGVAGLAYFLPPPAAAVAREQSDWLRITVADGNIRYIPMWT